MYGKFTLSRICILYVFRRRVYPPKPDLMVTANQTRPDTQLWQIQGLCVCVCVLTGDTLSLTYQLQSNEQKHLHIKRMSS